MHQASVGCVDIDGVTDVGVGDVNAVGAAQHLDARGTFAADTCYGRLLEDNSVTKVGLAWKNDALGLHELGNFQMGTFVDLQDMAIKLGIQDQSLAKLYANVFGERISKREQLTNWERDVLDEPQKRYAATDAWACVMLYKEYLRLKDTNDYELVIVPEENPIMNNIEENENISEEK